MHRVYIGDNDKIGLVMLRKTVIFSRQRYHFDNDDGGEVAKDMMIRLMRMVIVMMMVMIDDNDDFVVHQSRK